MSCNVDADCPNGDLCAFAIRDACNARGTCLAPTKPLPCTDIAVVQACGCSGADVAWENGCQGGAPPSGYAPRPIAHLGSCGAPPLCTTNADCPAQQWCAFAISDGCAAVQQCLPLQQDFCDAILPPACACDGTSVQLECGAQASPKPIAHSGPCSPADAGP